MQFVWTRLDSAIFSLCLTRAINFCYFDIRIDRANFGRCNIQLTQISTLTNTNRIKIVEKLSIRLCVVLCVGKNIQMANCDDDDAAAAENGTSIVHRLEFFFRSLSSLSLSSEKCFHSLAKWCGTADRIAVNGCIWPPPANIYCHALPMPTQSTATQIHFGCLFIKLTCAALCGRSCDWSWSENRERQRVKEKKSVFLPVNFKFYI